MVLFRDTNAWKGSLTPILVSFTTAGVDLTSAVETFMIHAHELPYHLDVFRHLLCPPLTSSPNIPVLPKGLLFHTQQPLAPPGLN